MNEKIDQENNRSNINNNSNNDDAEVFTPVEQGFEKVHSSIQRLTPAYTQSMSNLQQEILAVWKNLVCSGISTQRQYAEKTRLKTDSADIMTQIMQRMAEETARSFEMQESIIRAFLDSSRQTKDCFRDFRRK
ncbi:MAG: hypothetical protein ACR2LL_11295 [Nitrosopumilus sp.]|uniref:hypothetical protein n=1 Tax=Nitrosopumilus sp. TaxID=2024843 RepID=UPI002930D188|nr:hypothetical protein [Nitrosopumilus sp.]